MDDDWESEDFVPVQPIISGEPPKSHWEDEDTEEEAVKESWEDEHLPDPVATPIGAAAAPAAEVLAVATSVASQKGNTEKKKVIESKGKMFAAEDDVATKLDEKLRQQRLVEEADYQSTTELFGKTVGEKTLDNFIPKSESDFLEYAELIAYKLRPFEKSFHYLTLVKSVIRCAMVPLKAADAKETVSTVQVVSNEKLKLEKEATAGKRRIGAKKKQLNVDNDEDNYVGSYNDTEEYDFM
eukprot:c18814_g1_i1 orf=464-1183(+)